MISHRRRKSATVRAFIERHRPDSEPSALAQARPIVEVGGGWERARTLDPAEVAATQVRINASAQAQRQRAAERKAARRQKQAVRRKAQRTRNREIVPQPVAESRWTFDHDDCSQFTDAWARIGTLPMKADRDGHFWAWTAEEKKLHLSA